MANGLGDFVDDRETLIANLLLENRQLRAGEAAVRPGGPGAGVNPRSYVPNPEWVPTPDGPLPPDLAAIVAMAKNTDGLVAALSAQSRLWSQFWYTRNDIDLPISGTVSNQTIGIDSDSYFLATHLFYTTDLAAGAFPNTLINWQKTSGQNLMNAGMPVVAICNVASTVTNVSQGTLREFPKPVVWVPSDTMTFELVDRGSAAAQVVDISVGGFKVYTAGGSGFGVG